MLTRRHVLATAVAAPAILRFGIGTAHAATTLKISHQFPGGTIDKGDFRDRLCRMFATLNLSVFLSTRSSSPHSKRKA